MIADFCEKRRRAPAISRFLLGRAEGTGTAARLKRLSLSTTFLIFALLANAHFAHAQWSTSSGSTTTTDNVGIGTTSPGVLLHVKGSGETARLETTSATGAGLNYLGFYRGTSLMGYAGFTGGSDDFDAGTAMAGTFRFWTSNQERMRISSSGYVGIGTTSPTEKLDIVGNLSFSGGSKEIRFKNASGNAEQYIWHSGTSLALGAGNTGNSVFITNSGSVGLGTSSPSSGYKLDVNGSTNITGNLNITADGTGTGNIVAAGTINAKYQDVAEWVESSEQLATGTVVVLDSTKSNQVVSSSQSYDTRVAGVISAQPGISLGEKSDSKVLVATTGRVKVKVDATTSPIQIGDLLVTSDVPGVAMKSEEVNLGGVKIHRPGTLIGKALEPLAQGKGEILVLLSLQ